jgi:3-dehydroquinate synthetase/predicted NBD/HSP70 family sugar kinase
VSSLDPTPQPFESGPLEWTECPARRLARARRDHTYPVEIVEGLLASHPERLTRLLDSRRSLVVTTPTVSRLYAQPLVERLRGAGVDATLLELPCREDDKSVERVVDVCREAQRIHLDREGALVGLGGGVVLDVAKVAASWYRRGVRFVALPTTLIGQCDAGIGIKGAMNLGASKSALGCFYPPTAVWIDPSVLATVPRPFLQGGLSEVVKVATVCNADLFDRVERHGPALLESGFREPWAAGRSILWDSIDGMLAELELNFYEDQSYRRLVDFGHTFSPLIEAESGFTIRHGQAVSIDMALSCAVAHRLGCVPRETAHRVVQVLLDLGLPIQAPVVTPELCALATHAARLHRGGAVNLVLPTRVGGGTFVESEDDLPLGLFDAALDELRELEMHARRASVVAPRAPARACLVFDIGGTTLRAAVYDPATESIERSTRCNASSFQTHPDLDLRALRQRLLEDLLAMSLPLLEADSPGTVVVAFPGPIGRDGTVLAAPTLWGSWVERPVRLAQDLRALWPAARVHVLNDVAAAGYRYLRHVEDEFCIVTVGSGIGQKTFLRGAPIVGPAGRGGEIGHLRVDGSPDAPVCDCGEPGHLGAIASGRGALTSARRWAVADRHAFSGSTVSIASAGDPERIDCEMLVSAFRGEDPWATALIRRIAEPLGRTLASIHLSTGVERFVVYGGFALALGEGYRSELARSAERSCWATSRAWDEMVELGFPDDDSGLMGAGRFAARFAS